MEGSSAQPAKLETPKANNDVESDLEASLKLLSISKPIAAISQRRNATRTGLVYHPEMDQHRCLWDPDYEERPERFTHVISRIHELGLHERCTPLQPRQASEDEILTVHSKEYFEKVKSTRNLDDADKLEQLSSEFDAVFFHPRTFDLALYSAGCAIDLVTEIVENRLKNGFAAIRPPGHHAMNSEACGYCFFNNVALAARHAINNLGLERILIVDWDVHHGQATQYTFDDDPRVLYISIHRYERGAFWPELIESNYNWVGKGAGLGFNCNIPLNEIGINDRDYLAVFHNLILPLAYRFEPQLVLISAGFDAAIGCPEGEMRVSPATYAHLCHSLMSLAEGKVCVLLEGGYCLSSLAEGAALTLRALLGDPCPQIIPLPKLVLHKSLIESVLDVIWAQKPFWTDLFALQGQFDRHLESGDEQFHRPRHYPVVEYKGSRALKEQPSKYETRNCYPVQAPEVKAQLQQEIDYLKEATSLANPFASGSKQTVIAYHELMTKHKFAAGGHPERPSRIKAIYKRLKDDKLLEECNVISDAVYASDDVLKLAHTQDYIDKIKQLKGLSTKEVSKIGESYDSIYLTKESEENARLAVGMLLEVVDAVLTQRAQNGFAIIRPPGHHAGADYAAGFCIFNNVAIAAFHAIQKYNLSRVWIVDVDVHHGDGTQSLVAGNPKIVYISTHRYDYAEFYPSSTVSGLKNEHRNIINIPWNNSKMASSEYLAALFNVILPVAYDFNPELILVSAGFDAAINDPLGEYLVEPETYGHFVHQLQALAEGRLIVALEGGYNLLSISAAAANCVSVLLGHPPAPLKLGPLDVECQETLKEVVDFQSTNWPSLQFGADLPANNITT